MAGAPTQHPIACFILGPYKYHRLSLWLSALGEGCSSFGIKEETSAAVNTGGTFKLGAIQ